MLRFSALSIPGSRLSHFALLAAMFSGLGGGFGGGPAAGGSGGAHGAEPMKFMTFNVRYDNSGDSENAWEHRKELVVETIKNFSPDVLGVQEPLPHQMEYVTAKLAGYTMLGGGRDDGKSSGEFTAMFVRDERLEVVDSGMQWYADTPNEPGAIDWGASLPRMFVWAVLKDRQSGEAFRVYNTHWDHRSQESRSKAADAMVAHITDGERSALPAIAMGDLNANARNLALQTLITEPSPLRDTMEGQPVGQASGEPAEDNEARSATSTGTFHGFNGRADRPKIDWILASPEWKVISTAVDRTAQGDRYPSDHFPVTAVLQLEAK